MLMLGLYRQWYKHRSRDLQRHQFDGHMTAMTHCEAAECLVVCFGLVDRNDCSKAVNFYFCCAGTINFPSHPDPFLTYPERIVMASLRLVYMNDQ